ncbi:hypothetical protein ACVWXM_001589 [Bradyrhizobium sp. GM7.3]
MWRTSLQQNRNNMKITPSRFMHPTASLPKRPNQARAVEFTMLDFTQAVSHADGGTSDRAAR